MSAGEAFFFKKPNRHIFGINWETMGEFATNGPVCGGATVYGLEKVRNLYSEKGITPQTMTFGSGYWQQGASNPGDGSGCEKNLYDYAGIYRTPTIDTLKYKEPDFLSLIDTWKSQYGIRTILGMRQHASVVSGNGLKGSGEDNLATAFKGIGVFDAFLPGNFDFADKPAYPDVRVLNLKSRVVRDDWVAILRSNYGNFSGVKEDEMIANNRKGQLNSNTLPNAEDGLISLAYQAYASSGASPTGEQDFINMGSNDWFGVGTEAQVQGSVKAQTIGGRTQYVARSSLDAAFSQVASGYPHPMILYSSESSLQDCAAQSRDGNASDSRRVDHFFSNCFIDQKSVESFLRGNQLSVFSSVYMTSRGFWHLQSPKDQANFIYFAKLRKRLSQYAYDNAMRWYATGSPYLMRPLFIDFPHDQEVRSLYRQTTDPAKPVNEYMFGNALLVRPILQDGETSVSTYFPGQANYVPLIANNGQVYSGSRYHDIPVATSSEIDYPVFLKEGEILVIDDYDTGDRKAYFLLTRNGSSTQEYVMHLTSTTQVTLRAERDAAGKQWLRNVQSGQLTAAEKAGSKAFFKADIESVLP